MIAKIIKGKKGDVFCMEGPKCFKCEASLDSFTYIDYPFGGKLMSIIFCGKCGAVQGIVSKEL